MDTITVNPGLVCSIVGVIISAIGTTVSFIALGLIKKTKQAADESLRIQQDHRNYVKNHNRVRGRDDNGGGKRIKDFHRRYPKFISPLSESKDSK